jgi:hypothetical protein
MTESNESQGASEKRGCASGECLCAGAGPTVSGVLSQVMKDFGPSEPVRRHFTQARLEILKGLRAFLDQRINDIQKQPARGVKVAID